MNKPAAALIAVAAVAVLGACEKPDPRITVFSGTTSEWVAPICFSPTGELDGQQCLSDAVAKATSGQTDRLSVAQGNVVGISVDTSVAESGWTPMLNGEALTPAPLETTYFRFTMPQGNLPFDNLPLTVMSTGEEKGVWAVRLDINGE